jgi:ribonuclease E
LTAQPATESELSYAVADLDSPPSERTAPAEVSAAESAAVAQPEAPRRRSTIREPAPISRGDTAGGETGNDQASAPPSPATEPVITETGDAAEGERPRRTGWWSRRFAGG